MDKKTFEYIYHEANNGSDLPTDKEVDLMRLLLDKWEKEEHPDMFGVAVAAYYIGKYVAKHGLESQPTI